MPGKRHSEEQILYALRQVEGGKKVSEVCREYLHRPFIGGSVGTADWDCTRCESYGNCVKRIAS